MDMDDHQSAQPLAFLLRCSEQCSLARGRELGEAHLNLCDLSHDERKDVRGGPSRVVPLCRLFRIQNNLAYISQGRDDGYIVLCVLP